MTDSKSNGNGRSPKASRRSSSIQPRTTATKPLRLRIGIVGAEATGKSCLIKRYCEKRFVPRYLPTIGIDYGATKIYMDKREVSVHIFDTSGSPIFAEVRNEFYRDTHGLILVFDVANRESFDALCDWTKEIYLELAKEGRDFDKTALVVCANKSDLDSKRQVDEVEAKLWAEIRGFPFFETSAMTGEGINNMFHSFFSQIVKIHDEVGLPKTPSSARKVHLSKSGSSASVNSSHRLSNGHMRQTTTDFPPAAHVPAAVAAGPQPSAEQTTVMTRLRGGRDPWQQLGLNKGCGKEEVNKVYRRLAMMLHPDKTAVQGADEAFKMLGMARRSILRTLGVLV